jgi:hypothetical protein
MGTMRMMRSKSRRNKKKKYLYLSSYNSHTQIILAIRSVNVVQKKATRTAATRITRNKKLRSMTICMVDTNGTSYAS